MWIHDSELPQGSPEWLEWRKGGIGGSTVYGLACHPEQVTGVDEALAQLIKPTLAPPDWVPSPMELYREYFGKPRSVSLFHVSRGHRLEPVARELMEDTLGEGVSPICVFPDERPVCRVSLDGYAFSSRTLMEVKAPLHRWEALPDYVMWQTAYQAAVCIEAGLPVDDIAILEVFEEDGQSFCKRWPVGVREIPGYPEVLGSGLMRLAEAFYLNHLSVGVAPGLSRTDYLEVEDADWEARANAWKAAKAALTSAETAEEAARAALLDTAASWLAQHPLLRGNQVAVSRTTPRGAVDYKRAATAKYSPEELEGFRRDGGTRLTVQVVQ